MSVNCHFNSSKMQLKIATTMLLLFLVSEVAVGVNSANIPNVLQVEAGSNTPLSQYKAELTKVKDELYFYLE
jgi:hypothetical protein